ncbi:hypothetical protein ACGYK5_17225 [Sulfitobacter sp. 1A16787]|uniref:hypothetical protein n=1 Tax=Sulfitobacter sp. 1A16787 TaxID=3368571 RepID=UPI003746D32F
MKSRSENTGARPQILIIGHGGHGKDTAAAILARHAGLSWVSSSEFCAQKAIFPLVADLYPTWREAYADRRNHRQLWFHAIRAYNLRPGPGLAEQILADHQIYVGMRSRAEFKAMRHRFTQVIWVDASERCPVESDFSMELTALDADVVLDNNGCLDRLEAEILALLTEDADTWSAGDFAFDNAEVLALAARQGERCNPPGRVEAIKVPRQKPIWRY